MSTILITGGTGFIGGKLTEYYISKDKNVRLLVRNPERLPPFIKKSCQIVIGDITQIETLKNAFKRIIKHIKEATETSLVSLTCVLSKQTYLKTPELTQFVFKQFPKLYAIFFSVYKGDNSNFILSAKDIDIFLNEVTSKLKSEMNNESLELFNETLDNKFRIEQGIRFPDNNLLEKCYLSMSERVVDICGNEFLCSHLFRDNIFQKEPIKHKRCLYGCNTRLVRFNNDVSRKLKGY